MDRASLTRMQVRVVLTVYRAEMARLRDRDPEDREAAVDRLRARSLELLEDARARLDGEGPAHPDLLAELAAAHDEVSGEPRELAPAVSPGLRGDRPG